MAVILLVAVLFMQGFTSCNSAPKKADEKSAEVQKELFIGLQLYSVRDDMEKDVAGTIKAVGESGYKFVETAGYGDGLMYGIDPVEFKNLCEDVAMQIAAMNPPAPTAKIFTLKGHRRNRIDGDAAGSPVDSPGCRPDHRHRRS